MHLAIAVGPAAAVRALATMNFDTRRIAAVMIAMPAGRRRLIGGMSSLGCASRRGIVGGDSGACGKAGDNDSENEVAHHAASHCG